METKASLKAQIAAAKKAGKSMQTVGRLQYKLNQLNKDSKGTAVKTKTGVLKSKTGVVRQKDASKKVRKPAVKKLTTDRNPNTVAKKKAGPDMYKKAVALDKPKSNVTVTPYKAAKITDLSANKRAEQVRKNASPSGAAASRKLYEKKLADKKAAAKKAADKKAAAKKKADKKTYYSNLSGMV